MNLKVRVFSNLLPLGLLLVVGCVAEPHAPSNDSDAPPDGDSQEPSVPVLRQQEVDRCMLIFPQLERRTAPITIGGRTTQVDYKLVGSGNRLKVAQGDIVVGYEGGNKMASPTNSGVGYVDLGKLWPNARIPFVIDPDLKVTTRLMAAMKQWESATPIRFVPKTNESVFVSFIPAPEELPEYCYSWPGRIGEPQDVWLDENCTEGSIAHELGHLIGLFHEQARTDRDKYIEIDYGNVDPDFCRQFNTIAHIPEAGNIGSYDFGSIMHYPSDAFAVDKSKPTIKLRPGVALPPGTQMGQRIRISKGDVATVNRMYSSQ